MFLGMDDTDSPDGMCTTYLGAMLAENLRRAGYTVGEMRLVRLNPNVVWKTRGNAAVCLEISGGTPEEVFDSACRLVEEFAEFGCENTNPGIVVVNERNGPTRHSTTRLCRDSVPLKKPYNGSMQSVLSTVDTNVDVDSSEPLRPYHPYCRMQHTNCSPTDHPNGLAHRGKLLRRVSSHQLPQHSRTLGTP